MSDFPFDDIERLYREEDDLPPIPDWPSIFSVKPKPKNQKNSSTFKKPLK
jgi:hypothetical protein